MGAPELLILLAVVLLFFGGSRLPKLARSLSDAKRELDRGDPDRGDDHDVANPS